MKRIITILALVGLCHLVASAQKKYEMVIEKTDEAGEVVIKTEDIVRTYFREQSDGEGHSYTTCPDANHPHMIDLGLPSGTKWACCNVGASTPEGYGNYYAWGETQPKSVYDWDTYQYYNVGWINIGSDIAGTQYDAATANWGAPWRMPSHALVRELLNNCTSIWTTQNDVSGRKFTGPNGGTIFFPAAGRREDAELIRIGSWGHYWSSVLQIDTHENTDNNSAMAYFLAIYTSNAERAVGSRSYGRSVRPVR